MESTKEQINNKEFDKENIDKEALKVFEIINFLSII